MSYVLLYITVCCKYCFMLKKKAQGVIGCIHFKLLFFSEELEGTVDVPFLFQAPGILKVGLRVFFV